MAARLRYETGIAATAQFIVLALLNFINSASTTISQCTNGSGNCASDLVLYIVYFLAVTIWYAFLWLTGFATQDRRSRKLAVVLVGGEGLVFLVGLYDLVKHKQSIIATLISIAEIAFSIWVSWLAFRLFMAKGGRVRARHIRPRHPTAS